MKRVGIHTLSLSFPPMSNQLAEWLWVDKEVRKHVRGSKLYMIGQRKEALFENVVGHEDPWELRFDIVCGDLHMRNVRLPLTQFASGKDCVIDIEGSARHFRFFRGRSDTGDFVNRGELIAWYTPDRLFTSYGRNEIEIHGMEEFRPFTEFLLYYVGISKKSDSFSRLFATAHEKRSRILGNETQFTPTARLTDELTIFLFEVEDLQFVSYSPEELTESAIQADMSIPPTILAADAEKAFVSLMQSRYNEEKFNSYPKGKDGLYNAGFDRYTFVINDCLTFITPTTRIRGARFFDFNPDDSPDFITIEGDNVELLTPDVIKDRVRQGDFAIRPRRPEQ